MFGRISGGIRLFGDRTSSCCMQICGIAADCHTAAYGVLIKSSCDAAVLLFDSHVVKHVCVCMHRCPQCCQHLVAAQCLHSTVAFNDGAIMRHPFARIHCLAYAHVCVTSQTSSSIWWPIEPCFYTPHSLTCFVVMLTNMVVALDCIKVIFTNAVAEQQPATAAFAASCC